MIVYVSGLYSGPSPSPGIGVARSVRAAYPEAKIIGVDYWAGSPGIHFEEFDEIWLQPAFDQIHQDTYQQQIKSLLNQGAYWISTLDLEVRWLSKVIGDHKNLLSLNFDPGDSFAKPEVPAASVMNFEKPKSLKLKGKSEEEIFTFCRKHSWKVWLKSPYYEAVQIQNWSQFEVMRKKLEDKWKTKDLFLQAHAVGHEESLCFSAYRGELIAAILMKKKITTPDGKTWAGKICELSVELEELLRKALKDQMYTGGGELEFLVEHLETRKLIEWNPRFPAWIHGATLAGKNLVGDLLQKASRQRANPSLFQSAEFTRVVLEIPVKTEYSLPTLTEAQASVRGVSGKYGEAFHGLLETFQKQDEAKNVEKNEVIRDHVMSPHVVKEDLQFSLTEQTPYRVYLPKTAEAHFSLLRQRLDRVSKSRLQIAPALSIKTSPDKEYLELAKKYGFKAECISRLEVKKAKELGFPVNEMILNGPGKNWPTQLVTPDEKFHIVFCDSIEELEKVVKSPQSEVVGVRIRIPSVHSRFGISIASPEEYSRLVEILKRVSKHQKLGIHFHMASSAIGVGCWLDAFESLLEWMKLLEANTARKFSILDLGGGWVLDDLLNLSFEKIYSYLEENFKSLEMLIFEPGKALTQSTMALATKVLDVRKKNNNVSEIVVDACIAEMPIIGVYPHSILWRASSSSEWKRVLRGSGRILGRICMEDDILAKTVELPSEVKEGDELLFLDAGAYERSMSYGFGRGGY